MQLHSTSDPARFRTATREYLAERSVMANVPATTVETLLASGVSEPQPRFLWCTDETGAVTGAATWTPPQAVYVLEGPVALYVDALVGSAVPGVVGGTGPAGAFARRWTEVTGAAHRLRLRELAYRLDRLVDPPVPTGAPHTAGPGDASVVTGLLDAFVAETGVRGRPTGAAFEERLASGRFTLWLVDDAPVALAGRSPVVDGLARVGPVYTAPQCRGRGYGRALTATVCRQAFALGAAAVMLFADVRNPVSNAVYRQLGFRPEGCLEEYDFDTVSPGG